MNLISLSESSKYECYDEEKNSYLNVEIIEFTGNELTLNVNVVTADSDSTYTTSVMKDKFEEFMDEIKPHEYSEFKQVTSFCNEYSDEDYSFWPDYDPYDLIEH